MKIFITGGTGFIGNHLIDYFLDQKNAHIYALVRNRKNLKRQKSPDFQILDGDLFSIPSLPSDIDIVFHIAGVTKALKAAHYYTVNQHGTASLLRALVAQKLNIKRMIILSSQAVCGPSLSGQAIKESDPPSPISPYGDSKLKGENDALQYKEFIPLTILRAPTIYGPGDPALLPYFKAVKRGLLPSFGKFPRRCSMCYVEDLIRSFDLTLHKTLGSGDIFHVADPQPRAWDELGLAAGDALGIKLKKIKLPIGFLYPIYLTAELYGKVSKKPSLLSREKYLEMKQKAWIIDTESTRDKLGFTPKFTFHEAVKKTIQWYLQAGWL